MAVSLPDITAKVRLDTSQLQHAVGGARGMLGGLGGAIKGVGIVAAAAAAGGVYLLGKGIKASIENAAEGQRIMAETDRVIQSMGAGSWTSAEQIGELSSRLGRLSAAGDEAVQETANLLLTFGDIKNVGPGVNAVFDRATTAAMDMAQVLGTDAKSAALQLGKALQDPVKGITALSRAGVSFTEQQKEQIKTLVASGRTLEAQKIILAELERQVGGAAEAYGKTFLGAIDRAKNAIGDISELLGGPLIEALGAAPASGFADWLERVHDILQPLSQRLTDMFVRLDVGGKIAAKLQPVLDAVEGFLRELSVRFERVSAEIEAAIGRGDWGAVKATLGRIFRESAAAAIPSLAPLFGEKIRGENWESIKADIGLRLADAFMAGARQLLARSAELAGILGAFVGKALFSPEFTRGIAAGLISGFTGRPVEEVGESSGAVIGGGIIKGLLLLGIAGKVAGILGVELTAASVTGAAATAGGTIGASFIGGVVGAVTVAGIATKFMSAGESHGESYMFGMLRKVEEGDVGIQTSFEATMLGLFRKALLMEARISGVLANLPGHFGAQFARSRDAANEKIAEVDQKLKDLEKPRTTPIHADTRSASASVHGLNREIITVLAHPRTVTVNANTAPASAQVQAWLRSIPNEVMVRVRADTQNIMARQHGGFVRRFRPYLVGEAGPEWFVPRMQGFIVNMRQAAAAIARLRAGAATPAHAMAAAPAGGPSFTFAPTIYAQSGMQTAEIRRMLNGEFGRFRDELRRRGLG